MKKRKIETLHDKAVKLCEGQPVLFDGLVIGAQVVPDGFNPCMECQMDSLCRMEMTNLCAECECYDHKKHLLYLWHKKPYKL